MANDIWISLAIEPFPDTDSVAHTKSSASPISSLTLTIVGTDTETTESIKLL